MNVASEKFVSMSYFVIAVMTSNCTKYMHSNIPWGQTCAWLFLSSNDPKTGACTCTLYPKNENDNDDFIWYFSDSVTYMVYYYNTEKIV